MQKSWVGGIVSLVLILAVFVIPIWSSQDFSYCEGHGGQYPNAEAAKDENSAAIGAISTNTNWVFGSCVSGFLNHNGVGITAFATLLLTLVTGGLVWLGFVQFGTTRAQLRAYVFPDQVGIVPGTNPPEVNILFRNFGQTPAKRVVSWGKIDVIEPRHESTLIVPTFGQAISPLTLGANGTFPKATTFDHALNQQEITDVSNGTRMIYYYGACEYLDTFGRNRRTNFRLAYCGPFPISPGGMFFAVCNDGNGAD